MRVIATAVLRARHGTASASERRAPDARSASGGPRGRVYGDSRWRRSCPARRLALGARGPLALPSAATRRLLALAVLLPALGLSAAGSLALLGCAAPQGPRVAFPPAPEFPPGRRYTLDDLIKLSIHRNASLDVARYEAEAVQGLVDQVKALWLPALRYNFAALFFDDDFSYDANAFNLVSINVPITGNYNFVNAFSLTQILFTGGKRTSGLSQAKMFAAIKKLEVLRQQDAVAFDVANYYHLLCLTNDLDTLLEDTLRRVRVYRQVSEELNERGSLRASRIDSLQADFFASQLEQFRVALQAGRHQAYQALRHYVGVERDEPLELASASLQAVLPPEKLLDVATTVAKGFLARPESEQVSLFTRIREQQTKFAKAAWAPNLALLGTYTDIQGNHNTILGVLDGILVSLIVDVPIYDPARRGRLREALGLEHASKAFQKEVEDLISLEIEVTGVEAQRALATVLKAARAAQTAAEHYQATRQAYSRELVPASAVVTAIAFDMIAKAQYIQASFAYHNARAQLKRVTADRESEYGY